MLDYKSLARNVAPVRVCCGQYPASLVNSDAV